MRRPTDQYNEMQNCNRTARINRRTLRIILLRTLLSATVLAAAGCGSGKSDKTPTGTSSKPGVVASSQTAAKPQAKEVRRTKSDDETSRDANDTGSGNAPPVREPQMVYRPSDKRQRRDDDKLAQAGIHKYTSRRLILYTDIDPAAAMPLPELMDRAYEAWEAYFGPLPPDREKSVYQMTGYIMADKELFKEAGLLPDDLPDFNHGRHRGQEFWMNDQPDGHYREHLMLHEGTHCFMTAVPNSMMSFVWYMEGMAELFGTQFTDADGATRFRVMPHDRELFPGLGRIRLIEDEVREKGPRELQTILDTRPISFLKNDAYAWSWAVCEFLDSHPRYRDRFRRVGTQMSSRSVPKNLEQVFAADWNDLREEWLLFAANLCHGYDTERAAIDFRAGRLLEKNVPPGVVEIVADRGWQSSGVLVEAGKTYHITATGRFTLAQQPKPWVSEPQGISFRYHAGRPLGLLLGTIRSHKPPTKAPRTTMLEEFPIGRELEFKAPVTGTLYFRLNEFWSELADNTGSVQVEMTLAP